MKNRDYNLRQNGQGGNSGNYTANSFGTNSFYTDSVYTGIINFAELDYSKMVVAGTFHFDARDSTNNEIIHITDGKFRARMSY